MKRYLSLAISALSVSLHITAAEGTQEYLVKLQPEAKNKLLYSIQNKTQTPIEDLNFDNWIKIKVSKTQAQSLFLKSLSTNPNVVHIQPNYKISLLSDFKLNKKQQQKALSAMTSEDCPFPIPELCAPSNGGGSGSKPGKDNPPIPGQTKGTTGNDPLFNKQWGMNDLGVQKAWQKTKGNSDIIVAVIDTGVDYTHEDLNENIWRNPGETGLDSQGKDKSSNGVDDDQNGYIDDSIGWDFVSNDNKPYDLSVSGIELAFGGGNPGHGTHCAGNVAARGDNGKGIAGVAPHVKIMPLRFLSEKGQGTTADAIKAIRYAVDNGAKVLSNSWGSEGEDPKENQENLALREAISYSQEKGRLFIAAAGNGHSGKGYDNDTDAKPGYPASYDHDIIVSVAALDVQNNFGSFSNWGKKSVDLGAPGVKVFSTTVGSRYDDVVLNFFGQTVYWDGTSMATPHVAGAAALYWSLHPNKTWQEVKTALLNSAKKVPALSGKLVTDGKLDVDGLMNQ